MYHDKIVQNQPFFMLKEILPTIISMKAKLACLKNSMLKNSILKSNKKVQL